MPGRPGRRDRLGRGQLVRVGEVDHRGGSAGASGQGTVAERRPQHAEPGTYEVVLEASAVAVMIDYLSYSGCGAKQVIEGDSFLATKAGEVVAEPLVTVADEASHPARSGSGSTSRACPRKTRADHRRRRGERPGHGPADRPSAREPPAPGTARARRSSGRTRPTRSCWAATQSLEELIAEVSRRLPGHPLPLREHPRPALDPPHRHDPGRNLQDRERGGRRRRSTTSGSRKASSTCCRNGGGDRTGRGLVPARFRRVRIDCGPALRVAEFSFSSTTSH